MSVRQITRVFDMRVGDHVAKSVLVKLADFANDEGTSWPSIQRISSDTEIPERTVKRKLKWLEAEGFIARRKQRSEGGKFGLTFYLILPPPEATVAHGTGGQGEHTGGHHTRGSGRVPFVAGTVNGTSPPKPPRPKAGGKTITPEEEAFARDVLDCWNAETNSNPPFRSLDWIRKIVLRRREHPEVLSRDMEALIRRALANPWWDGTPSPAVVFGNGAVFEQALVSGPGRAGAKRFGRGLTAAQIIERGKDR